ncbi:MAG: hypothetical protein QW597_07075 [Thermoplasmataceae archaeon]
MTPKRKVDLSNKEGSKAEEQNTFDFFVGTWLGKNRKIKNYPSETEEWVEFDSITEARTLWNGKGNMDETVFHDPEGDHTGSAVRIYDAATKIWAIYFFSPGNLQVSPPRMGKFFDNTGDFFGRDTYRGQQVMARSRWEIGTSRHPRWEQAFSTDCGKTWRVNWLIQFSKQ